MKRRRKMLSLYFMHRTEAARERKAKVVPKRNRFQSEARNEIKTERMKLCNLLFVLFASNWPMDFHCIQIALNETNDVNKSFAILLRPFIGMCGGYASARAGRGIKNELCFIA